MKLSQFPLEEWPKGLCKGIAVIKHSPSEITFRNHIQFHAAKDDLDYYEGALILIDDLWFALTRHCGSPNRGTAILIGEKSRDSKADLNRILQALSLSPDDIDWLHPEIERL
jgi:hypothetical protein